MKRILPFVIILVVLGVALSSAWYLTRSIPASPVSPGGQPSPTTTSSPGSPQASPVQQQPVVTGVPGAEPAHVLGPSIAPVRLEEFGDFECPPCGMFHPILEQMEAEFGDKLRVTFRQFPLVPAHRHAVSMAGAGE